MRDHITVMNNVYGCFFSCTPVLSIVTSFPHFLLDDLIKNLCKMYTDMHKSVL